jgi:acetyltransferase-like isoleucine patch superfamily enzyme
VVSVRRGSITAVLAKVMSHPGRATSGGAALLRGQWYRFKYRLTGVRFRAGRNFRVYGRLEIRGPGEVIFGENVVVVEHARVGTHSASARIIIGNDVLIGETQFGCMQEIVIGDYCQLARSYIMDTDFHSTHVDRRHDSNAPVRVAPVNIGENVWVAHFVGILPGTTIGKNSIVSFGSVCRGRVYPPNAVLVGNPARVSSIVGGVQPSATELGPVAPGIHSE